MDRKQIINDYSKNEFREFLSNDTTGEILKLFNEEGTFILKKSELCEERIRYIFTYSPYSNELLKNVYFLDMFLDRSISNYYAVLKELNFDTYDFILNRSIQLNKSSEFVAELFNYMNLDYKLKKLDSWNYSTEILYAILKYDSEPAVIQKIITNYNIDLLNYDIDLMDFFKKAKQSVLIAQSKRNVEGLNVDYISIPPRMITEKMAERIWDKYNIFTIRTIINYAEYCTDPSKINNYIKDKEDQIIINFNTQLLHSPFKEIYEAFKNYKLAELNFEKNNIISSDFYDYKRIYLELIRKNFNVETFRDEINKIYNQGGLEAVHAHLKKLNDNNLSNYIIDYHFEENYHNIVIDMRELLNFYYNGQIAIPQERVELYNKISNMDQLSIEERIHLHNFLKRFNMIEIFYNDMALARYIVAEAIKEYSLTLETLKNYKDKELSEKYGVDIYNMNGNPFFGIVKTGHHPSDKLPTGHSYSLVGNGGIAVFGDVKDSKTYLYDAADMNPNQLVHAFPYDSYTLYHPFEYTGNATRRVNILAMPEELVGTNSGQYNELLILEKGSKETDIDKCIPRLKKIALYCVDEIRQQDIETAKSSDVGIILIDSKKYKESDLRSYTSYHHNLNDFEYNYFDGIFETEKFESRR